MADDLWGEHLPAAAVAGAMPGCCCKEPLQMPAHRAQGLVLTCKEKLLHYYAKFDFANEGVSTSTHGGVVWYQMRLRF